MRKTGIDAWKPSAPRAVAAESTKKLKYLKKPRKTTFTVIEAASRKLALSAIARPRYSPGTNEVDESRREDQAEKTPIPPAVEEIAGNQQEYVLTLPVTQQPIGRNDDG